MFAKLQSLGEKALICYVTAGDPTVGDLLPILETISEAGADIIEVGLPFSDPIADGPVIQAAAQRALDQGIKISQVFESLRLFQGPPIVLMGYYNSIMAKGITRFAEQMKESGITGSIVCDLIPEESGDWIEISRKHDLDTIFLAAPTSTEQRLNAVAASSKGFVYAVSRTGVTGNSAAILGDAPNLAKELKSLTKLPVCVGFGIDSPTKVQEVCQYADGAIVGSHLVQLIHNTWDGGEGKNKLFDEVKGLKQATK